VDAQKALIFAMEAHEGQMDKNYLPYILHPIRVAAIASTLSDSQYVQAVAFLHDTVEDTDTTLDEIEEEFDSVVRNAVDLLTRREEETYNEFTTRLAKAEHGPVQTIARVVKFGDLKDHLDRLHLLPPGERGIAKRYIKAAQLLDFDVKFQLVYKPAFG